MWDMVKQQQLNELREREQKGILTAEERQTLECLLHELEQEEWERLRPALHRLREEQSHSARNMVAFDPRMLSWLL